MSDFEWALTNALNTFFERQQINAIAYRLKQSRFVSQVMDILVDSRQPEYYLAIECKSLDSRKAKALYFKQHFSSSQGSHQLARETDFLTKSGRNGILAVEFRRGIGKSRTAYFLPWGSVYKRYQEGEVGISLEEIEQNPALERKYGEYEISELDIIRITGYYNIASNHNLLEDGYDTE